MILFLAASALAGCDDRAKEWTGWAYPDRNDLTKSESLSGFKSFEECQEATIAKLRSFPDPDAGDYECGYMCRWDASMQTNVCNETRK
jgi:hypothetical protein